MADNDITTKARKSHAPNGPRKPIEIGTRFGKWEVTGPPQTTKTYGVYAWRCRCECGNERTINGASLRFGSSEQCKVCAIREGAKRMPDEDLTGKRIGVWEVRRFVAVRNRSRDYACWICKCSDCGFESKRETGQLTKGHGCHKCAGVRRRIRPYETVYNKAKDRVIKRRDRGKTYIFTLTYETFLKIVATGKCHYCFTPITWDAHNSGSAYFLDRKDNADGYTETNCVSCCTRCNFAKGARYSYEEWWMMTACFRHKGNKKSVLNTHESMDLFIIQVVDSKRC